MLKYSSFREFPFIEIDHNKKVNKFSNKYQQYFDKLNEKYNDDSELYLENIRILKNFYDESIFVIKTKEMLDKTILEKMISYTDPNYIILEITDSWLGERKINEYNINDGKIEWFIKLKENILPNLQINHIGGYHVIDFLAPTYTPEYLLRYNHIDNKYKVPINIIINGKLYDKIWYETDKKNIPIDEIYLYAQMYLNKFLQNDVYIKNIIISKQGWIVMF